MTVGSIVFAPVVSVMDAAGAFLQGAWKMAKRPTPRKVTPKAAPPQKTVVKATAPTPKSDVVPPAGRRTGPIKVRATKLGYYGDMRRRQGDVFVIDNAKAFSKRWMEIVDSDTPEKMTTGQQVLRQQHDELLAARHQPGMQTGPDDVVGELPTGTANPLGEVEIGHKDDDE